MRYLRAEQLIEDVGVEAVLVLGVPPEPVASLRDHQVPPGVLDGLRILRARTRMPVRRLQRVRQQLPRAAMLLPADPGAEGVVYPRAREDRGEFTALRILLQVLRHRHRLQIGVPFDARVDLPQEALAGVGVPAPRVLPVKDDAHQRRRIAGAPVHSLGRELDAADEVASGIGRAPVAVDEADEVGEAVIAEDEREPIHGAPRAVEVAGCGPVGGAERCREHLLIGGGPQHALLGRDAQRAVTDRPLGGPHAARPRAEDLLVHREALADLPPGLLRLVPAPLRELRAGNAALGVGHLSQQREDRVVAR